MTVKELISELRRFAALDCEVIMDLMDEYDGPIRGVRLVKEIEGPYLLLSDNVDLSKAGTK